jgi:hypothetical protein
MFVPSDPRFDEIHKLAEAAAGTGLTDQQRGRWRDLCAAALGSLKDAGGSVRTARTGPAGLWTCAHREAPRIGAAAPTILG